MSITKNSFSSKALREISVQIAAAFPILRNPLRTVGRELEMPILTRDLKPADVNKILQTFIASGGTPKFKDGFLGAVTVPEGICSIEAGTGTFEFSSIATQDLFQLDHLTKGFLEDVSRKLSPLGYDAFGLGINPMVSDFSTLGTPKPHYAALRSAIGPAWDWFNVTCGDHVHVAVSRSEALAVRNALDLSTPLFQALFANSAVCGGVLRKEAMYRESRMRKIHPEQSRTGQLGFLGNSWEIQTEIRGAERHYLSRTYDTEGLATYHAEEGTFADWLELHKDLDSQALFDAYLFHDHYTWNVVRLRPEYGTVEMRVACAQPFTDGVLYPALVLGISEVAEEVANQILDQLPEVEDRVHWCAATLERPELQTAREMYLGMKLLLLAESGLSQRGLGEERLIHPLIARFDGRRNPAIDLKLEAERLGLVCALKNRALSVVTECHSSTNVDI